MSSITSEDVKTVALGLGGVYFLFKFALGYLMINASLTPTMRRTPLDDTTDLVVVSTKITKGDRECLQLDTLAVTVSGEHCFLTEPSRTFANPFAPGRPLRLSPGEETTFETAFTVPVRHVAQVDIALSGWSGPFSQRIRGHWRASVVSEPTPPAAGAPDAVTAGSPLTPAQRTPRNRATTPVFVSGAA